MCQEILEILESGLEETKRNVQLGANACLRDRSCVQCGREKFNTLEILLSRFNKK